MKTTGPKTNCIWSNLFIKHLGSTWITTTPVSLTSKWENGSKDWLSMSKLINSVIEFIWPYWSLVFKILIRNKNSNIGLTFIVNIWRRINLVLIERTLHWTVTLLIDLKVGKALFLCCQECFCILHLLSHSHDCFWDVDQIDHLLILFFLCSLMHEEKLSL